VLPPKVAPTQVVIVPIPYKGVDADLIAAKTRELLEKLQKNGISTVLDDRAEYTPGWKFNEWELKGVPVRIEIGPRDMKQKQIVLVRRDTSQKSAVKEEQTVDAVVKALEEIQNKLFDKAKRFLEDNVTTVKTYDEFKNTLRNKGGFIKASWCSKTECEEKIKEETGATIRLIPFEKEKTFARCLYCGQEPKEVVYFARSY